MINEQIRDREIRVVDEDGSQLGIMSNTEALEIAYGRDLDLVKIAPTAQPPVCKVMDYGKYRFELSKKEKEQRKNQKIVDVKGIRLSPTIDLHDMEVKARNAIKFLNDGDKVKVNIRFRGRQANHSQLGVNAMNTFYDMIKDFAVIESRPRLEGRQMNMMLAPSSDTGK